MHKSLAVTLLVVLSVLVMPTRAAAQTGANDTDPVWSPDGRQIMFISNRDGNSEIYVMAADGSNLHNISQSPQNEGSASWSRDSKQIVFVRVAADQRQTLVMVAADGSNLRPLSEPMPAIKYPMWSPDGKQLAFIQKDEAEGETLVLVNADGSNRHSLSEAMTELTAPQWSPDGTALLLEAKNNRQTQDLYLIELDTGEIRQLTDTQSQSVHGTWSPDSQWIAVIPYHSHMYPVHWLAVNRASGATTNLLGNYWFTRFRDCCVFSWEWSPDSQRLAFALPGDGNLYSVEVNTGRIRSLAYVGGMVGDLTWTADGLQIIFSLDKPRFSDLVYSELVGGRGGLFVLDTVSGAIRMIDAHPWGSFLVMADHQYVVPFAPLGPDLSVFRLDGWSAILELNYRGTYGFDWAPGSHLLAASLCVDGDADIYLLDIEKITSRNLTRQDRFSGEPVTTGCGGLG